MARRTKRVFGGDWNKLARMGQISALMIQAYERGEDTVTIPVTRELANAQAKAYRDAQK
jgi:hypothetical protein